MLVSFAENLKSIRQRIAAACVRAGRDENSVTLLAVSKTHPPETIQTAVDCGQLFFGENKIQEAKAKIPLCPGKARGHGELCWRGWRRGLRLRRFGRARLPA